jgi:hypothetical protein
MEQRGNEMHSESNIMHADCRTCALPVAQWRPKIWGKKLSASLSPVSAPCLRWMPCHGDFYCETSKLLGERLCPSFSPGRVKTTASRHFGKRNFRAKLTPFCFVFIKFHEGVQVNPFWVGKAVFFCGKETLGTGLAYKELPPLILHT